VVAFNAVFGLEGQLSSLSSYVLQTNPENRPPGVLERNEEGYWSAEDGLIVAAGNMLAEYELLTQVAYLMNREGVRDDAVNGFGLMNENLAAGNQTTIDLWSEYYVASRNAAMGTDGMPDVLESQVTVWDPTDESQVLNETRDQGLQNRASSIRGSVAEFNTQLLYFRRGIIGMGAMDGFSARFQGAINFSPEPNPRT